MKQTKIPSRLQPYLPSYDIEKLHISADKKLIITSLLNHGDQKALNWLMKTYREEDIKNTVKKPVKGFWFENVLRYWVKIFGLRLPKSLFHKATIHL